MEVQEAYLLHRDFTGAGGLSAAGRAVLYVAPASSGRFAGSGQRLARRRLSGCAAGATGSSAGLSRPCPGFVLG